MKKRFLTFCVVLPASVLLFSNIAPVHSSHARPVWRNGVSQADGVPLPPPPKKSNPALVADGVPLPPPPKKPNPVLAADGVPLPPPPKKPNPNVFQPVPDAAEFA